MPAEDSPPPTPRIGHDAAPDVHGDSVADGAVHKQGHQTQPPVTPGAVTELDVDEVAAAYSRRARAARQEQGRSTWVQDEEALSIVASLLSDHSDSTDAPDAPEASGKRQ